MQSTRKYMSIKRNINNNCFSIKQEEFNSMMNFGKITNEPLDYCVYAHINQQTGKVYVGITNDIRVRWGGKEKGYQGCPDFYPALQEYGWDAFDHIILIDGIPKSIALIYEHELIKKYNLVTNGYNRSYGSWNTGVPRKLSPPVFQYTLTGEFVRKWNYTTEAVAKYGEGIYDNLDGRVKKAKGYQWSYTYIDKMPPYETEHRHNYLPIYQYSIEGVFIKEFKTRDEAVKQYGEPVILCAKGKARTAYSYRWSFEKVNKLPPLPPIIYEYKTPPRGHYSYKETPRIFKYNFYGELIRIYDNVAAIDDSDAKLEFIYRFCKQRNYHIQNNMLWVYEEFARDDFIWPIIENYRKTHYKIVQYDINGNYTKTFCNYKEVEEAGFSPKVVSNAVHHKITSTYGYQWRSEFDAPPSKIKHKKEATYVPVIQKTLDGEIIKIFKNSKEAALEMQAANERHILNVCKGNKKTGYGFLWEFATQEEYENYINNIATRGEANG